MVANSNVCIIQLLSAKYVDVPVCIASGRSPKYAHTHTNEITNSRWVTDEYFEIIFFFHSQKGYTMSQLFSPCRKTWTLMCVRLPPAGAHVYWPESSTFAFRINKYDVVQSPYARLISIPPLCDSTFSSYACKRNEK